jgi:glycosyltransferase involved in cell wall biosynthesis
MKILISGIGRSGTTTIFNVLGNALLASDSKAETVYEPYLWNIREAYKTASVKGQPFDNNQLNVFGIYTHTHTPILLDNPTGLHDLWLKQNFEGLNRSGCSRLVKVIRGAGRLEATIKRYPDIKIVLVSRNPVDTINSGLGLFTFFGDEFHPSDRKRFIREVNERWHTDYQFENIKTEMQWSALWWKYLTISSFETAMKYPKNIFVLPYEAYTKDKKSWMEKILNFVGIPTNFLNTDLLNLGAGPLTTVSRLENVEVELLGDHCLLYGSYLNKLLPKEFPNPKSIRNQQIIKYRKKEKKEPVVKIGASLFTAVNLRINHQLFLDRKKNKLSENRTEIPLKELAKELLKEKKSSQLHAEKKISVIISSFNNETTIKDTIYSVLNQTMYVDEIIVSDDYSLDGTREIILDIAEKHKNVIPSFREYNVGVSANRDIAIRNSTGHLISTLDGDDLYAFDKIRMEYEVLKSHLFKGVAFSDIYLVSNNGSKLVETSQNSEVVPSELITCIAHRKFPVPRDMLFHKADYIRVGGFDLDISRYEDWSFKVKLANLISDNGELWLYSGCVGTIYDRRNPGLSNLSDVEHIKHQIIALMNVRHNLENKFGQIHSAIENLLMSKAGVILLGKLKLDMSTVASMLKNNNATLMDNLYGLKDL